MTRLTLPLHIEDVSRFSKTLAEQLGQQSPGHLRLLNMIARAAGFQNHQHLRAHQTAAQIPQPDHQRHIPKAPVDERLVQRTLAQFDAEGQLRQWPSRRAVQTLALFALWSQVPARTPLSEAQLNEILDGSHRFGDPATLRRTMIGCGLLQRERDGSVYERIEQAPPAEACRLISLLKLRHAAQVAP
ncbi:DUF2087 domain-containing protein [Phaeobacter sp.]|uniref:DUF2087 domain-containing protein n=1 Tax=Phaeobacter sp. TaxID=1902409 RepID=UPI0025F8AE6E|nr:DUF2087 domain-containing protein [Phaeobacter sp.]